jgi:diguanylate cyclase (GGDEF)-like protein
LAGQTDSKSNEVQHPEVERLRGEVARLEAALAEAQALADRDPLVPVHNRRAFMRELTRVMSFAERYGGGGAIVYFDLNSFKPINDRLGHAAGDEVLRHVGAVLLNQTRDSDVVGRLGGDEFAVILVHVSEADAERKAASLVEALRDTPVLIEGRSVEVSASHGLSYFTKSEDPEIALARADEAMYVTKHAARRAQDNAAA